MTIFNLLDPWIPDHGNVRAVDYQKKVLPFSHQLTNKEDKEVNNKSLLSLSHVVGSHTTVDI